MQMCVTLPMQTSTRDGQRTTPTARSENALSSIKYVTGSRPFSPVVRASGWRAGRFANSQSARGRTVVRADGCMPLSESSSANARDHVEDDKDGDGAVLGQRCRKTSVAQSVLNRRQKARSAQERQQGVVGCPGVSPVTTLPEGRSRAREPWLGYRDARSVPAERLF